MKCSTTISKDHNRITHTYTLTQEDIYKALRYYTNVTSNSEVEVYVINGELRGTVTQIKGENNVQRQDGVR